MRPRRRTLATPAQRRRCTTGPRRRAASSSSTRDSLQNAVHFAHRVFRGQPQCTDVSRPPTEAILLAGRFAGLLRLVLLGTQETPRSAAHTHRPARPRSGPRSNARTPAAADDPTPPEYVCRSRRCTSAPNRGAVCRSDPPSPSRLNRPCHRLIVRGMVPTVRQSTASNGLPQPTR
jgi:hypothetical protein